MVNIPWRIGVNMREFAYYDRPECLRYPHAVPPTREAQISTLVDLKIPLIRFFAAHRNLDVEANVDQIRKALTLLEQNRMQAIVCLSDSIYESGHTVPGNDSYHQMGTPMGHLHKSFWNAPAYRKHYLPYVLRVVQEFSDHPAVLAWELGNEFAVHPQPSSEADFDALLQFIRIVSHEIKLRSRRKLISIGLINTNQVSPGGDDVARKNYAKRLYDLPTIDLVSLHVYAEDSEDHLAMLDVEATRPPLGAGKPFLVGELGANITKTGNRPQFIRDQMTTWKSRGASSVMLWQFDISNYDSGVADECAFAGRWPDFDGIKNVVKDFAEAAPPFILETASHSTRFTLKYPMQWGHRVIARFDDPAQYMHLPTKVQKREGMLLVPDPLNQSLEVRAAQRGRVAQVNYYQQGYGHFVTIVHEWGQDTFVTWYGHLDSASVQVGQNVNTGDVIGVAGQSGSAQQICLFFTVQHLGMGRKNYVVDDVVNPLDYLTEAAGLERNEATYEADVTIEDGSILVCGQAFKKIWRIRNTGSTTWGDGYELAFFADTALGTVNSVPLPSAEPGESVQVAVDMIVPSSPGIYRSTWKPRTPTGAFFPSEQWVQIDARTSQNDTRRPQLRLVSETVPDGTVIVPGQQFVKTWRVRNTGNTIWNGYSLRFWKNNQMSGPNSVFLPELKRQQEGDVSVSLTAPETAGMHRSTWQPYDTAGKPFDYELYAEIEVRPEGGNNAQWLFASPISGTWGQGQYVFETPVPYGDGKHNGVDYVQCANQIVTAGGVGEVYKVFRCAKCQGTSFDGLGLNDQQRREASNNMDYVFGFGNLVIVRYAWADLPESTRQAMTEKGFGGYYAFAYYAHLTDDVRVVEGQAVSRGTSIGYVGNTGNSTAAHLHLEVRCYASRSPYPLEGSVDRVLLNPVRMFEF